MKSTNIQNVTSYENNNNSTNGNDTSGLMGDR
jgi:hypothetical protein